MQKMPQPLQQFADIIAKNYNGKFVIGAPNRVIFRYPTSDARSTQPVDADAARSELEQLAQLRQFECDMKESGYILPQLPAAQIPMQEIMEKTYVIDIESSEFRDALPHFVKLNEKRDHKEIGNLQDELNGKLGSYREKYGTPFTQKKRGNPIESRTAHGNAITL